MRKDCRWLIHEAFRDIGRKAGERGGNLLSVISIPNDFEQIITKLSMIQKKIKACGNGGAGRGKPKADRAARHSLLSV